MVLVGLCESINLLWRRCTLPTVIQIDFQADRARAVDVLADFGATYHCAPGNRFIISHPALELLRTGGVRFRVLGRRERQEETENAPNS